MRIASSVYPVIASGENAAAMIVSAGARPCGSLNRIIRDK